LLTRFRTRCPPALDDCQVEFNDCIKVVNGIFIKHFIANTPQRKCRDEVLSKVDAILKASMVDDHTGRTRIKINLYHDKNIHLYTIDALKYYTQMK
jgi:hypothetical protein